MKKLRIRPLLLAVILLLTLAVPFRVLAENPTKVYDHAALFSEAELTELQSKAAELAERLKLDVAIVTTNENDGKNSREYADDFYDQNGFGYGQEADGLLMLINMEDREVYISTCGLAIEYFTDARIQSMLDKVYPYLSDGSYANGAKAFLNEVETYVAMGIPSNQNTVTEDTDTSQPDYYLGNTGEPEQRKLTASEKAAIFAGVSIAVGGLVVLVMALNNGGTKTTSHNTYLDNNSFRVTHRQDMHVNTQVTHVTIKSNTSSGKSTTHSSSSGRTHGGGGRKF